MGLLSEPEPYHAVNMLSYSCVQIHITCPRAADLMYIWKQKI